MSNLGTHLPNIKGLLKPDWLETERFPMKIRLKDKITKMIHRFSPKNDYVSRISANNSYFSPKRKEAWDNMRIVSLSPKRQNKPKNLWRQIEENPKMPEKIKFKKTKKSHNLSISMQRDDYSVLKGTQKLIMVKERRSVLCASVDNPLVEGRKHSNSNSPTHINRGKYNLTAELELTSSTSSFCRGWEDM